MIKAIIFDCFGVILTDALSVMTAEMKQSEPEKFHELKASLQAANRGVISTEDWIEKAAELCNLSVEEFRRQIRDGEVRDTALLSYVKQLRQTYKTGVISNINSGGFDRRFPNNELDNYFDVLIGSSDVGHVKPEPEIYQIAAERLGVATAECVFTDDSEAFCDAARRAGMQAIHYKYFDQFKTELEELLDRSKST